MIEFSQTSLTKYLKSTVYLILTPINIIFFHAVGLSKSLEPKLVDPRSKLIHVG